MNWLKNLFLAFFNMFKSQPSPAVSTSQAATTPASTTTNTAPEVENDDEDFFASPKDRIFDREPDSVIQFYPKLVDHLEADHQQLLRLYTNVGNTLNIGEYQLIPGQLNKFKDDLKAHLEAENIRFYGYLEQSLKNKRDEFQAMRNFRKEMRSIERTVIKFLDKWITDGIDTNTSDEFKAEYDAIGSALVKRIESEEKELYILYGRI